MQNWLEGLLAVLITGNELTGGANDEEGPTERRFGAATGINWCEADYAVTPLIAEFWNTASNLAFVVVGAAQLWLAVSRQLPLRFWALATFVILTGLASAAFHSTLWKEHQKADEACENAILAVLWHVQDGPRASVFCLVHVLGATLGVYLVTAVLFAEVHLIVMAIACAYRLRRQSQRLPAMRRPLASGLAFTLLGGLCWVLDRLACEEIVKLVGFNLQVRNVRP